MFISIIFFCACVYLGYKWLCRRYIPPVHPAIPIYPKLPVLGHAHNFRSKQEMFKLITSIGKFTNDSGGVSVLFVGPYPFYVVTNPDDASKVLQKCIDKMFVYKLIEPLVGKMLVAAEVPTWKRSRRIIDLAFKQNVLENYLDLFKTQADRLSLALEADVGKGEVDVTEKVTRSILEATCRTTMGLRIDGEDLVSNDFAMAIDTFLEIIIIKMTKPWYLLEPVFNFMYGKKLEKILNIFTSLSKQMVKMRKEEHLQRLKNTEDDNFEGPRFRSFLDIVIESSVTEEDSAFTDNEIRNLVDNVLLAAFDTMVAEMIMILVCLGSYPEVQEKIYQEIIAVLGADGNVSKETLSKLVYLEAAIKEAIRLYPIGPIVGRQATTDIELRNTKIPAGSNIFLHLWALNRHPEHWGADAEEFKPERWYNDTLPEHPVAYASFCPGRRGCPGKAYALMYFKATLVSLIKRFKFSADLMKMKLDFNIMIKPHSGQHIKIEKR